MSRKSTDNVLEVHGNVQGVHGQFTGCPGCGVSIDSMSKETVQGVQGQNP